MGKIPSQHIHISNHHVVHHIVLTTLFANYTSRKLEKCKKEIILGVRLGMSQVPNSNHQVVSVVDSTIRKKILILHVQYSL